MVSFQTTLCSASIVDNDHVSLDQGFPNFFGPPPHFDILKFSRHQPGLKNYRINSQRLLIYLGLWQSIEIDSNGISDLSSQLTITYF